MITQFDTYLNEGYKEVDEIYLLADQVIEYFGNRYKTFFKELKQNGEITEELINIVSNSNEYKILIPFITQFTTIVGFNDFDNQKMIGEFFPEDNEKYSDVGYVILNGYLEAFYKCVDKHSLDGKDDKQSLKDALRETFRSSIAHEIQHAYDYFRSKGNFIKNKKQSEYVKSIGDKNIDELDVNIDKMYSNLPHEQWARFTATIDKIDFKKDFNDVLKQFSKYFSGYNILSEKDKKRLIKALYQYYDNKI